MPRKKTTKKKQSLINADMLKLLGVALVMFGIGAGILLMQNPQILQSKAAFSDVLDVKPKSGNWNYPDKFIVTNVRTTDKWIWYTLDCWDENYCQDQSGSMQLKPGESVELGFGEICAKWQLDIDFHNDGIWEWGGIAEISPEVDCNDQCRIGYVFTRQFMSGDPQNRGYIPRRIVDAAKPDGVELVTFDLWRTTLQQNSLEDVDTIVVGVSNQPRDSRGPLSAAEKFTAAELNLIKQAFQNGVSVIVAGDNASTRVGIDDAAGEVMQLVNNLQSAVVYNPILNVQRTTQTVTNPVWGPRVPFASSVFTDTTGVFDDPGYVIPNPNGNLGNSTCLASRANSNNSRTTCLSFYLPAENGAGFLYVDANASRTIIRTQDLLKNLLAESCQ